MTSNVQTVTEWRRSPWRLVLWGAAAVLIAAALYAWEAVRQGEYALIIVAAIFALVCAVVERAASTGARWAYGAGMAIMILTGLGQMWMNLAVGLVGSEDNPINLMFFALVGLVFLGALAVRGKPAGMVWVMGGAAVGQVAVGAVGTAVLLAEAAPRPAGMILISVYFVGLWLNAAALFKVAAARAR